MKKAYRVKKDRDFQDVFQKGQSYANRNFVLYTLDKPENKHFRIGISVGKKIGNAVARNRLKRQIRAAVFDIQDQILETQDFIIIARPAIKNLAMNEIKKNLSHVLTLAKLIK